MGRLGFNLVRENEPNKNVEAGALDKQNEKNENAEMKELAIAESEERKKSRKNLRGLMVFIAMIITFSAYIAIIRLRPFYHNPTADSNKIKTSYFSQSELLQAPKNVSNEVNQQMVNCMKELSAYVSMALENYRRELVEEKMLHAIETKNATEELNITKKNFEILQKDYAALQAQYLKKEEDLQIELNRMREERVKLLKKVNESELTMIDIEQSTIAPTAKPTIKRAFSLFNKERLKKMNDIVKHIEADTYFSDIGELLRKADEVFDP